MILLLLRGQGVFFCSFPSQLSRPGAVRRFCPCRVTDCRRLGTSGRPPVDAHCVHGTRWVPTLGTSVAGTLCVAMDVARGECLFHWQWTRHMPASGLLASLVDTPGSSCTAAAAAASAVPTTGVQQNNPGHAHSIPLSSSRCTTAALLTKLYMRSAHRVWTGLAGGGPT